MESEFIHLWELAGITKTEEQVRDVLEHMLGTDVSAAMKNSEGVYLCLACKEKKFYQVRQAAYAEFLRRRRVERRDEDEWKRDGGVDENEMDTEMMSIELKNVHA